MEIFDFSNFEELKVSVNRCMGITKDGKKCRTRLRKNQYLFCCENHKPLNSEILEDGCFCCMEKIINHKDGIFFKCKHLVHKSCFLDWSKNNSTYETPICLICRNEVYNDNKKKKKTLPYEGNDINKDEIKNILEEFEIENHTNQKMKFDLSKNNFIFNKS
jgi:hypothetical protein